MDLVTFKLLMSHGLTAVMGFGMCHEMRETLIMVEPVSLFMYCHSFTSTWSRIVTNCKSKLRNLDSRTENKTQNQRAETKSPIT